MESLYKLVQKWNLGKNCVCVRYAGDLSACGNVREEEVNAGVSRRMRESWQLWYRPSVLILLENQDLLTLSTVTDKLFFHQVSSPVL